MGETLAAMATKQMSKKRKFVHDGVLYAELNEFLQKELAEDGYAGVEIRRTPMRTEIIIRATRTREVLGEKGQRIRELTWAVQKRFGFAENTVEMFAERVMNQGVLGVRLKIMLPHDPEGKNGPKTPLPDTVTIMDPKEDKPPVQAPKGADEKASFAPT